VLCLREFRSSAPSNGPAAHVAGARAHLLGRVPRRGHGGSRPVDWGGPVPARRARSVGEPEPVVQLSRASKTHRGEGRDA
jgi:hypothetical protein